MEDNGQVFTKEEREAAKREEMMELLIEAFEGKSVLYDIYERRGWLNRLFTDKILSMDKDALYLSSQVAEICETHDYVIKNKRRELLDYVNPTQWGEGNSKIYKHNYISVFKLKMIHGLTGEGSEFTLPQLKELIYGGKVQKPEQKNEMQSEILFQLMKKMERFEKFEEMVSSGEFFNEIERKVQESTQKLLLEGSKDNEVREKVIELFNIIMDRNTSLSEKEAVLDEFTQLEHTYPGQLYIIKMYKDASEDKIIRFRQDEREIHIRKIKDTISELFDEYGNANNEKEREAIREKLRIIGKDNPELNLDIRLWLTTLGKEKKKKGFFGRLFS